MEPFVVPRKCKEGEGIKFYCLFRSCLIFDVLSLIAVVISVADCPTRTERLVVTVPVPVTTSCAVSNESESVCVRERWLLFLSYSGALAFKHRDFWVALAWNK